jgi:YwiC-like protein
MSQAVRLNDQLRARVAPRGGEREKNSPGGGVQRARLRPVALPTEHGGWGLTLEPAALGLLVAPSAAGFLLALAALFAFLARHPLKIVAGDRRRGRRFPRTALAERFALAYSLASSASFAAALAVAPAHKFLYVVAAAAPLAAAQLYFDLAGRG